MSSLESAFGAWLKVVLPNSGVKERDERLELIRTLTATVELNEVTDLVLAYFSVDSQSSVIERLREGMLDVDTGFGAKDAAELAVLSAGLLAVLIEKDGPRAIAVALAVLCAEFGPLSLNSHVPAVLELATNFLASAGAMNRESRITSYDLDIEVQRALEENDGDDDAPEEDEDEEEEQEGEADSADGWKDGVSRLAFVLKRYGAHVDAQLELIEARRAEQSDILYWLLSGRREIDGVELKGLKKEQAVLCLAAELAHLTRQLPGPTSAAAILSTLLESCKKATVSEATLETCIEAVTDTDGKRVFKQLLVVHPQITSISFALKKAEENGWAPGWENAVKTQTGLASKKKYPIQAIAEQLYRELLLSRTLGRS